MTGFKPLTSGVRSDRSANWATTTAHHVSLLVDQFDLAKRLAICAQTTWPRKSADRKWVSIYSALESESNLKGRKKSSKNLFDLFANDPFSAYFEFEMFFKLDSVCIFCVDLAIKCWCQKQMFNSVTIIHLNKPLWLDVTSHVTALNQSDYFI